MKAFGSEFVVMQEQFEKNIGKLTFGHKFERVPRDERSKVPATIFYNDGYVNDMFQAYMHGYALKESLVRLGE
jgi:hypothetical protein